MADLLSGPGSGPGPGPGPGPRGATAGAAAVRALPWDDERPAAVLFDLDGTLIDSEPMWSAAVGTLVREHGHPWHPVDDAAIVGWSVPALVAEVLRRGVPLTEAEVVTRLHRDVGAVLRRGMPWRPGARHLLAALHHSGIPLALVSATHSVVVDAVVASAPADVFTVVVAGDGPGRPKPSPDPYLHAAEALAVDPRRCIAVEDSPTGVRAALAAGTSTVAMDPTVELPADLVAHPRLRRVDGLDAVGRLVLGVHAW